MAFLRFLHMDIVRRLLFSFSQNLHLWCFSNVFLSWVSFWPPSFWIFLELVVEVVEFKMLTDSSVLVTQQLVHHSETWEKIFFFRRIIISKLHNLCIYTCYVQQSKKKLGPPACFPCYVVRGTQFVITQSTPDLFYCNKSLFPDSLDSSSKPSLKCKFEIKKHCFSF